MWKVLLSLCDAIGVWRNLDVFVENVPWFFKVKMSCLGFNLGLIV